ncbi:Uncharacterized protein dnm_091300 [Desulfonema magnum]|uniref:Uncharacterized protein n=1 Tax=Desulfonema magnum TaxID=45655 RepID=A0A975BWF0_9BACT|nr:Uncharacterized protein dnm_091300 [Desulfonema magnum]
MTVIATGAEGADNTHQFDERRSVEILFSQGFCFCGLCKNKIFALRYTGGCMRK